MTDLRAAAHDYLTIRRRLGFELKQPGRTLEDFVEFTERAGVERVTTELALMWATSVQAHPHRWRRRLGVVRGFARYPSTIDPATEIPPAPGSSGRAGSGMGAVEPLVRERRLTQDHRTHVLTRLLGRE